MGAAPFFPRAGQCMSRRDLLVIAVITLIVGGSTIAIGGHLKLEPAKPLRTPSIGLQPEPSRPTVTPPASDALSASRHAVTFRVNDELSGQCFEANVNIRIVRTDGETLDYLAGSQGNTTLGIDGPFFQPLWAVVSASGVEARVIGPFVVVPGGTQVVSTTLARKQWVTVKVTAPPGKWAHVVLFQDAPPEWPSTAPLVVAQRPVGGECRFLLPPGTYWCAAHATTDLEATNDRAESLDFATRAWISPVTVSDKPVVITAELVETPGDQVLRGRVVNELGAPLRDTFVRIYAYGPGALRRDFGRARCADDGSFVVEGLRPGLFQIISEESADSRQWAEVSSPETMLPALLVRPRLPRDSAIFTAPVVGRVKILCHGKPVPGAVLEIDGTGTLDGWSTTLKEGVFKDAADENGIIHLDRAGRFVVSTRPYCATRFELNSDPLASGLATFELAPPGTGSLRVEFGEVRNDFSWCGITSPTGGSGTLNLLYLMEPQLLVHGLAPGTYSFSSSDSNSFLQRRDVVIEPDREIILDRPFQFRSVAGDWPVPGCWVDGSQLTLADTGNPPDEALHPWSPSNYPPLAWERVLIASAPLHTPFACCFESRIG